MGRKVTCLLLLCLEHSRLVQMAADRFGTVNLLELMVLMVSETLAGPTKPLVYTWYNIQATWYQGGQVCLDRNGTLAQIPNEFISGEIKSLRLINGDTWIGLHASNAGNYWWTNCQPLGDYHPWSSNSNAESEGCVVLDNPLFEWATKPCTNSHFFLCESEGDQCTFTKMDDTIFDTTPDVDSVEHATEAACRNSCLQYYSGCKECVGYSFTTDNHCLMFTESDVSVQLPVRSGSAVSGVKSCYSVEIYQGSVELNGKMEPISCDDGVNSTFPVVSPTCTYDQDMGIFTSEVDPALSEITSDVSTSMLSTPQMTDEWSSTQDKQFPGTLLITSEIDVTLSDITSDVSTRMLSTPQMTDEWSSTQDKQFPGTLLITSEIDVTLSDITSDVSTRMLSTPQMTDEWSSTHDKPFPETLLIISETDVTLSDVLSSVFPSMSTIPPMTGDWLSSSLSGGSTETTANILKSTRYDETAAASTSVSPVAMCSCPCPRLAATNDTVRLEEMVKKLVVKKTDLSSFRRTKESAKDDRPSAQAVGKVGIAVLIAAGLLVLLFDADIVIKFLQKLISPRKYLSK